MNDINNPIEVIKVEAALKSERMKLEYRKLNKPEDITTLDYTIISALEKQIPKKCKVDIYKDKTCPSCESILQGRKRYCCWCGQRLDWDY